MGKLLTFIELKEGRASGASLEALKGGQELAKSLNHTIHAVVFGSDEAPTELTGLALDEVLTVSDPQLSIYTSEHFVAAMAAVLAAESPDLLIAGHTYQARDWLPRLATRMARPLVSDCVGFQTDAGVVWMRPLFQGKIIAQVQTTPGLVIVSFQAGAFRSDELVSGAPSVRSLEVELAGALQRVQPGESRQASKGSVDLSRAERIVAVGRGIGSEENLALVRALANALDAELGSSRPVVDFGWLPHAYQVGSSGQTVSPKLYLALGISGAIQHQVGMKGAGCIVAINKDPHAPIFEIADYGIVGDLLEILPHLTKGLNERAQT